MTSLSTSPRPFQRLVSQRKKTESSSFLSQLLLQPRFKQSTCSYSLRSKKEGWICRRWNESDKGLQRFNWRGLVLENRPLLIPTSRQFYSIIVRPSVVLLLTPVLCNCSNLSGRCLVVWVADSAKSGPSEGKNNLFVRIIFLQRSRFLCAGLTVATTSPELRPIEILILAPTLQSATMFRFVSTYDLEDTKMHSLDC